MSDCKVAVISDTHLGARGGSNIFREHFRTWYRDVFFPKLKEEGINTVLHGGDFFDNRNSISLADISYVVNEFAALLREYNISFIVIPGNHDVAYKNTNKIHSLEVLKSAAPDNVEVVEGFERIEVQGQKFLFVPWVNNENYDEFLEVLDSCPYKKDTIVLGHFEITDFKMYKNSILCEGGLDRKIFKGFQEVWSGHFHHPSKIGSIRYLGSAFYLNWQDHGDDRGWWIYDTASKELEYQRNEHSLFCRADFAEVADTIDTIDTEEMFSGKFVVLVVDEEYDRVALLDTVRRIKEAKPIDVEVENNYIVRSSKSTEAVDTSYDTKAKAIPDYMEEYIDINYDGDDELKSLSKQVMEEAETAMYKGE